MSTNLLEKSVFMHSLVGEKSPKKRCWSGFWKVELKILTGLWCFWSLMWLLASRLRPRKLISLVNVRSHFLKSSALIITWSPLGMKTVPCVSNIWLFFFWARHKHLKVSCDEGILTLNILLFLERTMFHSCNWRVLSHSPVFKYLLWSLILTTNYSINDSGLLLTRFYILN